MTQMDTRGERGGEGVLKSQKILINQAITDFSKCGVNIKPTHISEGTHSGNWQWMASLGEFSNGNWSHYCGASLINKTTLITAAHCVKDNNIVLNR
jgi:hypothetical protein